MSKVLDVKPLSQRDPQWNRSKLGNGTVSIGGYGCVLVSATMLCNFYGKDITPLDLNDLMKENGGFVGSTKNLFDWQTLTSIYPDIKWEGRQNFQNIEADIANIRDRIDREQPTIIRVEADEIGTPKGDHFMIVVGYDNTDLYVIDPWDEAPHTFRLGERYSNNGSNKPEHIILGTRMYDGKHEEPVTEPDHMDTAITLFENFYTTHNFGNEESAMRALIGAYNDTQKKSVDTDEPKNTENKQSGVETANNKNTVISLIDVIRSIFSRR